MYHYVRNTERTRFCGIKAITIDNFRSQLSYIKNNYSIMSMEEIIEHIEAKASIPKDAIHLTFDDAYIDHFINVFPLLDQLKIKASFFVPVKCLMEQSVLNVNKIHFILSSVFEVDRIIQEIFNYLNELRTQYNLESNQYYYNVCAHQGRYDDKDTNFIKKILQKGLPKEVRTYIIDQLFTRYVTTDEKSFHTELYMSQDQILCLKRHGMYIGNHGYNHDWLDTLNSESQEKEIDISLGYLKSLNLVTDNWIMCYPYGAYNDSLISILNKRGCVLGLTTKSGIADLSNDDILILPRLNTNDLPF